MRLHALGGLHFDVRARTDAETPQLQLRIGPLQFGISETEAVGLANRLIDAVEQLRRQRNLRQSNGRS